MVKKLKIRLADVARVCGVSVTTVDRVIHGRPGVKKNTAAHILSVIEQLESGGWAAADIDVPQTQCSRNFDVILPHRTNDFYNNIEEQLIECASRPIYTHINLCVHRVNSFDPLALAEAIEEIAKKKPDGLALVAINDPRVRNAINQVSQSGIPLITLVSDIASCQRTAYIGIDNRACGRTAGYLMGRFLGDQSGTVLMLAGSHLLSDHEQREIGFTRVLREYFKQLQIIPFLEDKDDDSAAYEQVKQALANHKNLVGIYDIGAGTRGITKALKEAGRELDTVFIGHELTEYSRELLTDGVMDAVIDQVPKKVAQQLIEILENGVDEDTSRENHIHAPIFFRENLP